MNNTASETGLLEQVRRSCRAVTEQAERVRINYRSLPDYSASLPVDREAPAGDDPARRRLGTDEETVAFIVTLDTINFGSGYFPRLRKGPGISGYFTVANCLRDYFQDHGPLSAARLSSLTGKDCGAIFGQDSADDSIKELMGLFSKALNQLGDYLAARFRGSFTFLIEAAGGSAEQLVKILISMPFFNDAVIYRGEIEARFYKRAQIMAADLSLAFSGRGPGRFDDLGKLTIFADNLVPHVLRCDGILEYGDDLDARIEAGELIPAGSPEEIEIRASAVHAAELIIEELRKEGRGVRAMELDDILWKRGQLPDYKNKPRHRARTVFY